MPTIRPRHQVTETVAVAHALDVAERHWPGETRSQLLVRLVRAGGAALERAADEKARRRAAAVDESRGRYADAFLENHLTELRGDWPA